MSDENIIQVGFKMPLSRKNVIKSRASAQGSDMQTLFEGLIDKYFEQNPITDTEQALIESLKNKEE